MKLLIQLFAFLTWVSCGTLNSTTYIDPKKSFVIGEGNYGGYWAKIMNASPCDIEVTQSNSEGVQTSLGILKKEILRM